MIIYLDLFQKILKHRNIQKKVFLSPIFRYAKIKYMQNYHIENDIPFNKGGKNNWFILWKRNFIIQSVI